MNNNANAVELAKTMEESENILTGASDLLYDALDEDIMDFNLGAETHVDVSRIPATVVDIPTLVAHLRDVRARLSNRPAGVKNEDFEVAKQGLLKQYKMYACAMSAMHRWSLREASDDWTGTPKNLVSRIIDWGKDNPEPNLGGDGKKMWTNTFTGNEARLKAVMFHILALIHAAQAGPQVPRNPRQGVVIRNRPPDARNQGAAAGNDRPVARVRAAAARFQEEEDDDGQVRAEDLADAFNDEDEAAGMLNAD